MTVLDLTVVNVAVPSIARAMRFSAPNLQWLLTAYALTYGALLVFGGRTGDLYGRRRMFTAGVAVFAAASLAAGLATNQLWLVIARGAQGLGAAVASPTALSLIANNFSEGPLRNRALGIYAGVSGAGGAVGLLLGGVVTDDLSWRWIFFINVPIAVLALAGSRLSLEDSREERGKLDIPGTVTVTAGVLGLVYGLTNAASHGWGRPATLLPILGAAILLSLFVAVERVHPSPLMPLSIFAHRNRACSFAFMLTLGTSMFSTFFFLSQYLQNIRHYSALRSGLAFAPMAVGFMLAALVTSRVVTRVGIRFPLLIGPLTAMAGLLWLTRLTVDSGYLFLFGPLNLIAFGFGQCLVPLTFSAVAELGSDQTGLASALLITMQQVGGAVGLSILGTVTATAFHHRLTALHPAPSDIARATVHAYAEAFFVGALLAAVAFAMAAALIRTPATSLAEVPA
jgi:EmrB/QacA subfamily drug resistance transporter